MPLKDPMADDILAACQAIDPAFLVEIVRQDLNRPGFELGAWEAAPVSHEKVVRTTGGLFCFRGIGQDSGKPRSWSVILKIVRQLEGEGEDIQGYDYWRRELLAYQTGLLTDLPAGIRAPRCYGVSAHAGDGWIWMENVQEISQFKWDLAQFAYAAHQLGRFGGAYLVGRPLPDQPWLCQSIFRNILADGGWWARFINPDNPRNAWQNSTVQKIYSEPLRRRVLQLWADKWRLIGANDRLPRVFCHNDAHRRNFMIPPGADGTDNLVAIDWAFCGLGGLGNDLGELVGIGLSHFDVEPEAAGEFEAAVLAGYQAGLHSAGWEGDFRLARLGYQISLALWWGATLPHATAITFRDEARVDVLANYGRPIEAVISGWTALAEFTLERAERARVESRES
jgi:hypothetical protein